MNDLFEAARDAMARAHAPYSNFPVGAAIRDEKGHVHVGANIEVVSFPEGWCAETTAIGHMVMAGGRRIEEIAVVAQKMALCSPCGGCRQRIAEFAGPKTRILLCDETGVRETVTTDALLPRAFQSDGFD